MDAVPLRFIIRDGIETDLEACLTIDHQYETEHVWQMGIQPQHNGWQVQFRTERLPRQVRFEHASSMQRLQDRLPDDQCFLVAVDVETEEILGYLSTWFDMVQQVCITQDIVVAAAFRRIGIGKRLLKIAQQWALEHGATHLLIETTTHNYPCIQFCQSNGFSFCGFNDRLYRNNDIALYFGQSLR